MSQTPIPEEMTAVVLHSYDGAEGLRVEKRPVPRPGPNQVLVKIAASVVNPSDLSFIAGRYAEKKPPPVIPGIEGSGVVVAADGGLMGRYLLGKQVACSSQGVHDGLWAEYVLVKSGFALPLGKGVSLEQGAMSVVNPLTALALLSIVREGQHKAFVNTAAASMLGQMMIRLAQKAGVTLINIVHREAQVSLLQALGASLVLNSSDPDFEQQLHDLCHQHEARLAFDAIAGPMTMTLLNALPEEGRVTVYGRLSHETAVIDTGPLVNQNKVIDGFLLGPWTAKKSKLQQLSLWRRAQKLMSTDLHSSIRDRCPLQDVVKAITAYENQMSGGKILLVPNQAPEERR